MTEIFLIGYSGHAYEVIETFRRMKAVVSGYYEPEEKANNPYKLNYCGSEKLETAIRQLQAKTVFVAIGDNGIRKEVLKRLDAKNIEFGLAVDPSANLSESCVIGQATLIAKGVLINAQTRIGVGVICNSGSIIEHECLVGNYTHIGPGATLCGSVQIGEESLIGAGATILPGIKIGNRVTVGAGSVVCNNVPDGAKVAGNPARSIL